VQRKRDDLGKMRISEMDEAGIDLQVISENNPATQNLDAETAIKLARASNDLLYEPFQGLLFNFKNNSQAHAEKLSKFQVSSHGPVPAPSARCPHFGHVTFSSELAVLRTNLACGSAAMQETGVHFYGFRDRIDWSWSRGSFRVCNNRCGQQLLVLNLPDRGPQCSILRKSSSMHS